MKCMRCKNEVTALTYGLCESCIQKEMQRATEETARIRASAEYMAERQNFQDQKMLEDSIKIARKCRGYDPSNPSEKLDAEEG